MKKYLSIVIAICTFNAAFAQINTLTPAEKAAGFQLLFNGKDLTGWRAVNKQTPPVKGWEVVNGTLHVLDSAAGGKSGDLLTVGNYKAFELRFECKLTPGANSGLKYFVTEPANSTRAGLGLEYQLLDDDLHSDANAGTEGNRKLGSLYDLIPSDQDPKRKRPIGEWLECKIIAYPDKRVEHWLNGVKVLEYTRGNGTYRVLVAHSKFAKIEGFGLAEQGPILLQDHGNSVFFRNMKIKELK